MNRKSAQDDARRTGVLTPGITTLMTITLSLILSATPRVVPLAEESLTARNASAGDVVEVVTTDGDRFYFVLIGSDEDGIVGQLEDGQIILIPFFDITLFRVQPAGREGSSKRAAGIPDSHGQDGTG